MINIEHTLEKYYGQPLEDNQYLLKIRERDNSSELPVGFLTKLTQKSQLPKAFDEWQFWHGYTMSPIYIFTEKVRVGWRIIDWRFGKSQNWAEILHPCGFIVEIYLNQLLDIIKSHVIIKGEIQGEFKWQDNKLVK